MIMTLQFDVNEQTIVCAIAQYITDTGLDDIGTISVSDLKYIIKQHVSIHGTHFLLEWDCILDQKYYWMAEGINVLLGFTPEDFING